MQVINDKIKILKHYIICSNIKTQKIFRTSCPTTIPNKISIRHFE